MAINIKNREAERLLNALARRMRLGKTQLVLELLRQQSARQARLDGIDQRRARIKALVRRASRQGHRRALTDEQIIGYGKNGLPT